jgi:hypothetical protein
MPLFETRDLAIYASIIGTLDGAWAVYSGVIRDRPRIVVQVYRAEAVPTGGFGPRQPMFMVKVANRGRRAVTITHAAYTSNAIRGTQMYSVDLMQQLAKPRRLDESESMTLIHGQHGGRTDLPTKRWFVQDGALRIHPLRERYRQRAESFVFWPLRRLLDWRDKRDASADGDDLGEL